MTTKVAIYPKKLIAVAATLTLAQIQKVHNCLAIMMRGEWTWQIGQSINLFISEYNLDTAVQLTEPLPPHSADGIYYITMTIE